MGQVPGKRPFPSKIQSALQDCECGTEHSGHEPLLYSFTKVDRTKNSGHMILTHWAFSLLMGDLSLMGECLCLLAFAPDVREPGKPNCSSENFLVSMDLDDLVEKST